METDACQTCGTAFWDWSIERISCIGRSIITGEMDSQSKQWRLKRLSFVFPVTESMCAALQRDMNVKAAAVVQVQESPSLMQAWNRLSSYSQESRASLHSEPPQGEEGRDERGGECSPTAARPSLAFSDGLGNTVSSGRRKRDIYSTGSWYVAYRCINHKPWRWECVFGAVCRMTHLPLGWAWHQETKACSNGRKICSLMRLWWTGCRKQQFHTKKCLTSTDEDNCRKHLHDPFSGNFPDEAGQPWPLRCIPSKGSPTTVWALNRSTLDVLQEDIKMNH